MICCASSPQADGERLGCRVQGLGLRVYFGLIAHTVMSTTKDYCRHIKARLTPYLGAIPGGGPKIQGSEVRVQGLGFRG